MKLRFLVVAGLMGLAITAVMLFALATTVEGDEPVQVTEEFKVMLDSPANLTCSAQPAMEAALHNAIASARICQIDDECALAQFGCPFGCWTAVNVDRLSALDERAAEYRAYLEANDCSRCVYRCPNYANPAGLCVEGLCTLVDVGLPDDAALEPRAEPLARDQTSLWQNVVVRN